ncbi:BTAD domain-containing putative transcriptional regulator [Actinomadura algeriensis]|uniref:DNA-binding SARP family transcriptional activator n=1 Tax=Actinomadura algeriensis TaxID=1679523 RepID=A0ABR9JX75_9ACTN|nr:BTAD domain-containing putative transcriptional regulator [Actinomadura algeriensis]MBE1534989.1 DNA-binding SARP family transcriptional activator [Actinomadura algeriensis]
MSTVVDAPVVSVLGAFGAVVDGAPADLGGRRRRSVLARLAAAHGRMVPADTLVEDLWAGTAPPRAGAGLQSFVSHLRRALEPRRPPRTPARVLVTAPPGYALRLPDGNVDAWRFDALVDEAGALLAAGDPAAARRRAEDALARWDGPAYAEFADLPWAAAEAVRLDERRRLAVERRAEALLALGGAAEAVPDLEEHAAANPLREEASRLLALALYRAGRQGDALAALRRARAALAEELGVDPGPALRRLEAGVLAQDPDLGEPPPADRPAPLRLPPPAAAFVGRDGELALLDGAAERGGVVLVGGDAGMGKTALTERFARRLGDRGWTCAWGRAQETGGAPAAWPWAELLRDLTAAAPPAPDAAARLAPLLDDAATGHGDADVTTGRFRLHLAVGDYLAGIAARAPLLLVLEDLHWADDETLALLVRLADRLRDRRVLLAATFRRTEAPERLDSALAALARREPLRIDLGGLAPVEVAELVRATCATGVADAEMSDIAERTGGNPFFVRETARLMDAEGAHAAARRVPAGVGDVLRRRIARLPGPAQGVLRDAAVVGRDADLAVLTDLARGDEETVIDAVEAALAAGLVTEPAPGRTRFVHALVRDTLYDGLSRARRTRLHGRVAAALERHRPAEVAAIAHHYLESGAEPGKAVRYARLAAAAAEARFAHGLAADLWVRAAETLRAQGPDATRERLEAEVAAIRACGLSGDVMQARDRRLRAIAAARALGDVRLLARVITAFDVPTLWTSREYGTYDREIIDAAEEALHRLPDGADELRVRLLTSLAIEMEGEFDDRGVTAADEAVALARALGRPALLAVALNGRYINGYRAAGDLAVRERLARELLGLAEEHDLGAYRVLAHLQLQQTSVAGLDLTAAGAHLAEGRRLADQYGLPLLGQIASWYSGLVHVLAARFDEAERAYVRVSEDIGRTGIWSSEDGIVGFGAFCLRLVQGRPGELLDRAAWLSRRWSHVAATADIHALALADTGRVAEARAVVAAAGPIRPDYFFDLATAVRAHRAIVLDQRDVAEDAYTALLPYERHFTGGCTTFATIGPVAQVLGDLAVFLGRPAEDAAAHYRRAVRAADTLGAPLWSRLARESLAALDGSAA